MKTNRFHQIHLSAADGCALARVRTAWVGQERHKPQAPRSAKVTVPARGGAQGTHMALRWILALPQAQPTSLLCLALPAAASVLHQFPCLLSCWDPMPAGPRPSCQAPTGAPRLLSICRPDRSLCGMEGRRTSRGDNQTCAGTQATPPASQPGKGLIPFSALKASR